MHAKVIHTIVPDRRKFGHVNVVCVYSYIVLVGRRGMGEGAERGGSGMRQLTLSNESARMGIHTLLVYYPVHRIIITCNVCFRCKKKYSFCAEDQNIHYS
jgi:hypothetical protein